MATKRIVRIICDVCGTDENVETYRANLGWAQDRLIELCDHDNTLYVALAELLMSVGRRQGQEPAATTKPTTERDKGKRGLTFPCPDPDCRKPCEGAQGYRAHRRTVHGKTSRDEALPLPLQHPAVVTVEPSIELPATDTFTLPPFAPGVPAAPPMPVSTVAGPDLFSERTG